MASLYWEQGEQQESIRLYKEAIQISRDLRFRRGLAHALRALGESLLSVNEQQDALPHLLESTKVFAEMGDDYSQAVVWGEVAPIYEQALKDYQEACAAWEKAHALWIQTNDRRGALEALQQMGRLTRQHLGKPMQALQYLQEALNLAKVMGDHTKQGELLNTMGIIEWQRAAYPNARAYYEQALQVYRELGDTARIGFILNSLGVTLERLGHHDEALTHLQEAVVVNRQAAQRLLEGHGLAVMGDVYRDLGEHAQALHCYQASLDIRRDIRDRKGEGWMLHALALVYVTRETYAQARECVVQALAIAEEVVDEELHRACAHVRDQLSTER